MSFRSFSSSYLVSFLSRLSLIPFPASFLIPLSRPFLVTPWIFVASVITGLRVPPLPPISVLSSVGLYSFFRLPLSFAFLARRPHTDSAVPLQCIFAGCSLPASTQRCIQRLPTYYSSTVSDRCVGSHSPFGETA